MQIKKMTSLVLAAMISLSLAACGSSQTTAATSGQTSQQEVNAQSADSSGAKNAESAQDEGKAEVQQTEAAAKNESSVGKNILILYFSADNTRDVDVISSATPMADGTSSVEWIANIIHENVGGKIIRLNMMRLQITQRRSVMTAAGRPLKTLGSIRRAMTLFS